MKQSGSKSNLSYNICINSSSVRADGQCPLVLRAILNRKKKEFNLNIKWPKEFFDDKMQRCLPRFKGDVSDCESANILIEDAKARASKIALRYYANDRTLSLATFGKEFDDYKSKENLLKFWESKTEQLYSDKIISYETYRRHRCSRKRLETFLKVDEFSFNELSLEFIQKYDSYLRRAKFAHNTVCGFHKDLKTYINHAIEYGHRIDNPYNKFSYSYRAGVRDVLDMDELRVLLNMVDSKKLTHTENEVLKGFLFSCFTGLRVSDNRELHSDNIKGKWMTVKMKKGMKYGKQVNIPLPKHALALIEGRKGKIFKTFAEQTRNASLKLIAAKAGINKKLTFHVSRDTFGTTYIELGGDAVSLKEIMGHTNIAVTMIYVKISEKRKQTLMSNFDKI